MLIMEVYMEDDNLIFSYTRRQAIEDGVLIEIPKEVQDMAGFKYPMVITCGVFNVINNDVFEIPMVITALWLAIHNLKSKGDTVNFIYKDTEMYAKCHPDDDGISPVITIMLIGED